MIVIRSDPKLLLTVAVHVVGRRPGLTMFPSGRGVIAAAAAELTDQTCRRVAAAAARAKSQHRHVTSR
jgi:hypothetical protein